MSTNSLISIEVGDKIHSVYCHFDGYLEGVGATLKKHYTNEEDILNLIEEGDISHLGENLGTTIYLANDDGYTSGMKTFVHLEPKLSSRRQLAKYVEECICYDYVYFFSNGEWFGESREDFLRNKKEFIGLSDYGAR